MNIPRRLKIVTVFFALVGATQVHSAQAAYGVTSVSGATLLPGPPPPNVFPGSYEVPVIGAPPTGEPILFPEVLGGVIMPTEASPIGLDVDHDGSNVVASPAISGNVVNPMLIDWTISVGTKFNSYLLHFDPAVSTSVGYYNATISFLNPVIGLQLFGAGNPLEKPSGTAYVGTLELGDIQIAMNGGPLPTYYPGSANFPPLGLMNRGIDDDSFQMAIAGNTVTLIGSAGGVEIDQIRILTADYIGDVPEPALGMTWWLISLLAGNAAVGWRRR